MQKKNNSQFVLQRKVVGLWVIVILGMFALWGMHNPIVSAIQNNKWAIESVIAAAEKGDIISGTIQGLPSKGFEWYELYGEARKTEGSVPSNDDTEQVIINGGNFLQKLNNSVSRNEIRKPHENKDSVCFMARVA